MLMMLCLGLTTPLLRVTPVAHSASATVCRTGCLQLQADDAASSDGAVDKQLSDPKLIRFSSISEEFKPLCEAALIRLDRNRVLNGKPKYETIEGMIESYVVEAGNAGLGWTRDEAESEVTRYLMRQALADEGGIGGGGKGDGQDKAAFALLGLIIGILSWNGLQDVIGIPGQ